NCDRDDADDKVDIACAFQSLDQLRAEFRAADCSDRHNEAEPKIDIAERAMTLRRHYRLTHNVREIGSDGEVPIKSHRPQGRTGDEASADSKKSAEDTDDESRDYQIDWIDVRMRDRKIHHSERPRRSSRKRPVVTASSMTA